MDKIDKQVLLIAASILAAPKLASQLDSKASPSRDAVISDAVRDAEDILHRIDKLHPDL
jgi:hypothetical protein